MSLTTSDPPNFFTVDRVVAGAALLIAAPVSLLALGTAAVTKLHIYLTEAGAFEERVGRALLPPAALAFGGSVLAAVLLLNTTRQSRPVLSWMSALLSVAAIVVSLNATADYRRRLDPRAELTAELESLDLGVDATVVLRTSRALPHLPEVRWVYRVPLRGREACARARAALEVWADVGTIRQSTSYACALAARRNGGLVRVNVGPEGAPLTRGPTLREEALDTSVHYVMVELKACTGNGRPCTRPSLRRS